MKENNLEKITAKHIDDIGYQIPNPENYTKHMVAKLILKKSEPNDIMTQIHNIDVDVSKKYFLSPGDNN